MHLVVSARIRHSESTEKRRSRRALSEADAATLAAERAFVRHLSMTDSQDSARVSRLCATRMLWLVIACRLKHARRVATASAFTCGRQIKRSPLKAMSAQPA
jgi:hypothetical protein